MPEQHRKAAQNILGLIHLTDWMPRDHTWQLKRPRNARGSGGNSHGCRTSQPTLCDWSALISIRRVAGESKSANGRGGGGLVELAQEKKILDQHFCDTPRKQIQATVTLNSFQHCFWWCSKSWVCLIGHKTFLFFTCSAIVTYCLLPLSWLRLGDLWLLSVSF